MKQVSGVSAELHVLRLKLWYKIGKRYIGSLRTDLRPLAMSLERVDLDTKSGVVCSV